MALLASVPLVGQPGRNREPVLGPPTNAPLALPDARGARATPGQAVQAPALRVGYDHVAPSANACVPYARIVSQSEHELHAGDVAFVVVHDDDAASPMEVLGIDDINVRLGRKPRKHPSKMNEATAPVKARPALEETNWTTIHANADRFPVATWHTSKKKHSKVLRKLRCDGIVLSSDACAHDPRGFARDDGRLYNVAIAGAAPIRCDDGTGHGARQRVDAVRARQPIVLNDQLFDASPRCGDALLVALVCVKLHFGMTRDRDDHEYMLQCVSATRLRADQALRWSVVGAWHVGRTIDASASMRMVTEHVNARTVLVNVDVQYWDWRVLRRRLGVGDVARKVGAAAWAWPITSGGLMSADRVKLELFSWDDDDKMTFVWPAVYVKVDDTPQQVKKEKIPTGSICLTHEGPEPPDAADRIQFTVGALSAGSETREDKLCAWLAENAFLLSTCNASEVCVLFTPEFTYRALVLPDAEVKAWSVRHLDCVCTDQWCVKKIEERVAPFPAAVEYNELSDVPVAIVRTLMKALYDGKSGAPLADACLLHHAQPVLNALDALFLADDANRSMPLIMALYSTREQPGRSDLGTFIDKAEDKHGSSDYTQLLQKAFQITQTYVNKFVVDPGRGNLLQIFEKAFELAKARASRRRAARMAVAACAQLANIAGEAELVFVNVIICNSWFVQALVVLDELASTG
jgi:hypothetical protein